MLFDPFGEILSRQPAVSNLHCVVPTCKSSLELTPNKLFLFVPFEPKIRCKWLRYLKVDLFPHKFKECLNYRLNIFCCEDHFSDELLPAASLYQDVGKPNRFQALETESSEQIRNHLVDHNYGNILPEEEDWCIQKPQTPIVHNFTTNESSASNEENCPITIKQENENISEYTERVANNNTSSSSQLCEFCYKEFVDISALQLHIRENHLDIKPEIFQCNKCSSSFVHETEMLEHLSTEHSNSQPEDPLLRNYELNKKFYDTFYLNENYLTLSSLQRNQSDFKPIIYDCKICPLSFIYEYEMLKHKKVFHKCKIGSKLYIYLSDLEGSTSINAGMQTINSIKTKNIVTCQYCFLKCNNTCYTKRNMKVNNMYVVPESEEPISTSSNVVLRQNQHIKHCHYKAFDVNVEKNKESDTFKLTSKYESQNVNTSIRGEITIENRNIALCVHCNLKCNNTCSFTHKIPQPKDPDSPNHELVNNERNEQLHNLKHTSRLKNHYVYCPDRSTSFQNKLDVSQHIQTVRRLQRSVDLSSENKYESYMMVYENFVKEIEPKLELNKQNEPVKQTYIKKAHSSLKKRCTKDKVENNLTTESSAEILIKHDNSIKTNGSTRPRKSKNKSILLPHVTCGSSMDMKCASDLRCAAPPSLQSYQTTDVNQASTSETDGRRGRRRIKRPMRYLQ